MAVTPLTVVAAPKIADEIRQSTIRTITRALEEAEKGDVVEIVIIERHIDGTWTHLASRTGGMREMIGAIELIKIELAMQSLSS